MSLPEQTESVKWEISAKKWGLDQDKPCLEAEIDGVRYRRFVDQEGKDQLPPMVQNAQGRWRTLDIQGSRRNYGNAGSADFQDWEWVIHGAHRKAGKRNLTRYERQKEALQDLDCTLGRQLWPEWEPAPVSGRPIPKIRGRGDLQRYLRMTKQEIAR